jgi:carbamoyltransferase
MTITFNCTPRMRQQSPGVVHVDGTARPQLIDPDTAPDFYRILQAYHALTGIPSLINTSFNMHEEPIVCTPRTPCALSSRAIWTIWPSATG